MKGGEVVLGVGEQPDTPCTPLPSPSGGHRHLSRARMDLAGTRKARALAWKSGSLRGQRDPAPGPGAGRGARRAVALPDAHGGLDEGGDAHAGEDGADEVADGQLVLAHAQALGQQEGDGDGAAEAGQVVLGGEGGSAGLGGPHTPGNGDLGSDTFQAVPGSRAGCRGTRGARPRSCRSCPPPAGGAWCPPRGPAGGAQLSLCHPGAACRDGHPTLPYGSPCARRDGRGPGWPGSIRRCVTDGFGVWCCPRGSPVLTLPATGSSFPGVCGEPAGPRAKFPFWQWGRGRSWVSVDPGVPRERGWALLEGRG